MLDEMVHEEVEKICELCGAAFTRGAKEPRPTWNKRRFCGQACGNKGRSAARSKELIEDLEFLIGTDHPESIARRVGYVHVKDVVKMLRNKGRHVLAETLAMEYERYLAPLKVERDKGPWLA